MLISNIYVDDDSLKPPEKNYSVNAPGAHILLVYDDAQSFETPRINNRSFAVPSAHILLGDDDSQSFETPPQKTTVSLHQVPRFC